MNIIRQIQQIQNQQVMKVKIRNKEELEIESFRIKIGKNEYLLKENAEGLKIINIDNRITLQPDVNKKIG